MQSVFCASLRLPMTTRCGMNTRRQGTGFVIGFDTTHAGFRRLTAPMGVLKVSYDSAGFPTFLGMMEKNPYEPLFRKRMEYAFEQEWRSIRMLKDLEAN